jgi:flagellar hook-associated protein 1 FlgK
MSLIGALNIGKSAMAVQQAAIQVTGQNIANAGNADYARQSSGITPGRDQQIQTGIFIGTGVNLTNVQRQIDEALEGRLRSAVSDNEGAKSAQEWLGRIEATFNELSDDDLSTQLSTFFNSWSNLANKPQDIGLRQVVIQNGDNVAKWFSSVRGQLADLQSGVADRMTSLATDADALAKQVADLNAQIVIAEGGSGGIANGLRDQRDAVLKQLSGLIDIRTINADNGVVNVFVGSEPLVINAENRGVGLRSDSSDGQLVQTLVFKANGGEMKATSGQLGALAQSSRQINDVVDKVDQLAGNLIFELNKLHASGQGLQGLNSASATNTVADADATLNTDDAGLAFAPSNGSFVVHVKNKTTGLVGSTLVQVDLDGSGGNDTTLNSLAADLDAITGISATVNGGRLSIRADSNDAEFGFSQDSSGALAALGINTFYNGKDASDITVNPIVSAQPALLAAARNGQPADNQTARAIAGLESKAIASLSGASLKDTYQAMINGVASASAGAKTNAEAADVVEQTLQAQRESLSGVSLDEEAVNLIRQQRAFQGAARLITAVNEMMDTVLNMVR